MPGNSSNVLVVQCDSIMLWHAHAKHTYDSLKRKLTASDDDSSSSKTSPQLQTHSVY